MLQQSTVVEEQARSPMVEGFARFWANPNPAVLPPLLAEDVVGHFPATRSPCADETLTSPASRSSSNYSPTSALKSPNTPRTASSTSSAGSGARPEQRGR